MNKLGNLNSYGALSCTELSKLFLQSVKYSYLLEGYMEGEGIKLGVWYSLRWIVHITFLSSSNSFFFLSWNNKGFRLLRTEMLSSPVKLSCTTWISYRHTILCKS